MWSQLVKLRVKPGSEGQMEGFEERWEREVGRGTDSGWVQTQIFKNPSNSNEWYLLATFESEEKARQSENNPKHQEVVGDIMDLMESEPEYTDLDPVYDSSK